MSQVRLCPSCGAEVPVGSPADQCPKCLLKEGFRSDASAEHSLASTAPSPAATGFEPPPIDDLAPLFPQLELLDLLGKGGMGAVYKARQRGLDRLVAVKILPPEVGRDPAFAERFTREARAMARLSHPHIVAIHDFGQTNGQFYFVMEYVDGANLRQVIRNRQLTPPEALAVVPQICDALQYAHDEGIVHRDIKPENILIDTRGRVKIADFGLSKLLCEDHPDVSLTGTHQVMGTLRYMAPEQLQGTKAVDHRADIYSLGVVFYELLTGQIPMGRFDPPSKKVQVDVRLDEVVLRALEQEPHKRYQHASEVKTDVEAVRNGCHAAHVKPATAANDPSSDGGAMPQASGSAWPPGLSWASSADRVRGAVDRALGSVRRRVSRCVARPRCAAGRNRFRLGFGSTTKSVQAAVVLLGWLMTGLATSCWCYWLYHASCAAAARTTDAQERARVLVRGPALGLILIGLFNLPFLLMTFLVLYGDHFFGDLPTRLFDWGMLLAYVYCGWMPVQLIQGGLKILELESHADAVATARTSLFFPNLNLLAFVPVSLWALTVLGRRDVRAAFEKLESAGEKEDVVGATYARPADVKSKQPDQHASDMKTEDEALPTSQIEGRSSIQTVSNPSPLILVTGAMLLLSALTMIAGGVMTTLAFVLETPGSQQFWGWMGGGLGCLLGGLGSLFGCLNSYRQMISGEDLMKSPRRTWLDNALRGLAIVGAALLIVGLLLWSEVSPKSTRALLTVGGVLLVQVACLCSCVGPISRKLPKLRRLDGRWCYMRCS